MRIDNVLVYNNNFKFIKVSFDKFIIEKTICEFQESLRKENDDRYHKIATNTP